MKNVEVRIRHMNDGASESVLGTTDNVDGVIPLLKRWGLLYGDVGDCYDFSAQFIVTEDGQAYFEVIIGDDDAQ